MAYGVRVHLPGFRASDDAFTLEPEVERRLTLLPDGAGSVATAGALTALNMHGQVRISVED